MTAILHEGDCLAILPTLDENSVDAVVTDPPYHLTSIVDRFGKAGAALAQEGSDGRFRRASAGFMGQQWDGGDVALRPETWGAVLRVLKPGAHLAAFGGTRTFHRMAVAIEDAGFEIRDTLCWLYATGFPKSHDVSKGIDSALGAVRAVRASPNGFGGSSGIYGPMAGTTNVTEPESDQAKSWSGWGTALKPAWEPVILARKPLSEKTVAANELKWGTGAINIDGCRIESERPTGWAGAGAGGNTWNDDNMGLGKDGEPRPVDGRWPANVTHDGSDDVLAAFPNSDGGGDIRRRTAPKTTGIYGEFSGDEDRWSGYGDAGSAARFFYSAKADADDRWGSKHPTVKPVDLIRWLARLITPPRGLILDPFGGSGTLAVAALAEGFDATLIEREAQYCADIRERIAYYSGEGRHSLASKNRNKKPPKSTGDQASLFADPDSDDQ